jgi:hypothetical protein
MVRGKRSKLLKAVYTVDPAAYFEDVQKAIELIRDEAIKKSWMEVMEGYLAKQYGFLPRKMKSVVKFLRDRHFEANYACDATISFLRALRRVQRKRKLGETEASSVQNVHVEKEQQEKELPRVSIVSEFEIRKRLKKS